MLIFHYKKNCYFAIGFYFFGKSIQKNPDPVRKNDVNKKENVCASIICQTIEWEVNYSTATKKKLFSSAGSYSSAIVARGDEWSIKIFNCPQIFTFARFARKI